MILTSPLKNAIAGFHVAYRIHLIFQFFFPYCEMRVENHQNIIPCDEMPVFAYVFQERGRWNQDGDDGDCIEKDGSHHATSIGVHPRRLAFPRDHLRRSDHGRDSTRTGAPPCVRACVRMSVCGYLGMNAAINRERTRLPIRQGI